MHVTPPRRTDRTRPTPAGWSLAGAGAFLTVLGFGAGYPEPALLGVFCLGLLPVALLWTLPTPRLSVRRRITPNRVARGDAASGVVAVVNQGMNTSRGLVVEDSAGGRPVPVRLPTMRAGTAHEVGYPLPTDERGRIAMGPLRLVRTDPFGLVRRVRVYGAPEELLVRPRVQILDLPPSGREHHLEGRTSETAAEGTLTFHALRDYIAGDDLRLVHWAATAHMGTLMVRQMVDVSRPRTTVILDTAPAAYPGRGARTARRGHGAGEDPFELAVDTAASVVLSAVTHRFPVHVVTGAGSLTGPRETSTADALLDLLAVVSTGEQDTLAKAFDVVESARWGGTLIVVTGPGGHVDAGRVAGALRRHERVIVVQTQSGADSDDDADVTRLPSSVVRIPVADLGDLAAAWARMWVR